MSRSYKKSYSYITGCRSKKSWRSFYNRRFRHVENSRVSDDDFYSHTSKPNKIGYADLWAGPTDGHSFYCIPGSYESDYVKRRFCSFKKHGHHLFHK